MCAGLCGFLVGPGMTVGEFRRHRLAEQDRALGHGPAPRSRHRPAADGSCRSASRRSSAGRQESMMSFTPIGMPCSRPWRGPRSSTLARSSAASRARCDQASTWASRWSMRSRWARTIASAVTVPASICCASSVAVSVFGAVMIDGWNSKKHAASMLARFVLRSLTKPRRFRMLSRVVPLFSPLRPSLRRAPRQAQQPSTLRIAMTLADIPVTDGAPDQGTEGIRFMGYTMYDPLVTWDLSSATDARQAGARPRHQVVPGPGRSDEMDLRAAPGREVPSTAATFTADAVIFTLDRTLDDKSPSFDRLGRSVLIAVALADRRPIARSTTTRSSCRPRASTRSMPSLLNRFPDRQPRQLREGRQGLAGLPQVAVGHRAVEDEGLDAARARRARAQHRLLEQGPHSQDRAPGAAADPRRVDAHGGAAVGPRRLDRSAGARFARQAQARRLQDRNQRHPAHVALHAQHAAGRADGRHPRAQGAEPRDRPRRHGEAAERARGAGGRLRAARPSVVRHAQLQDQVRSGRGQEADGRGRLRPGQAAQDQGRDLDLGLGPDVSADHERVHPAAMCRDRRRRSSSR